MIAGLPKPIYKGYFYKRTAFLCLFKKKNKSIVGE